MSRPTKVPSLLSAIASCIEGGRFLDTRHAHERQSERQITRAEILHVLLDGFHEKKKDRFEELYNTWNYAIRGKTVDQRDLRVIVSFDLSGMLIITAFELGK